MNRRLVLGSIMMFIGGLLGISTLYYTFFYIDESELTFELGIVVIIIISGITPYLICFGYEIKQKGSHNSKSVVGKK